MTQQNPNSSSRTPAEKNLLVTDQGQVNPDAEVTLGPDNVSSPRDLQRAVWRPDRCAMHLIRALRQLVGDDPRADRRAKLVEVHDVTALKEETPGARDEYHYAWLAAYALESEMERWRFFKITRQLGGATTIGDRSTLDDVTDGPVRILEAASTELPELSVDLGNFFDLRSNQRTAVLRHLVRLSPGVRVRIIGSKLNIRRLIQQHGELLPSSVTERAKSGHLATAPSRSRTEETLQHARELLDDLGPGHIDWKRLWTIYTTPQERRSYDALQNDMLCEFSSRDAVKQFVRRSKDRDLVEPYGPRQDRQVRLLPLAVAALDEHPSFPPEDQQDPTSPGCGPTDVTGKPLASADANQTTVSDPPKTYHSTVYPQAAGDSPHRTGGDGGDGNPGTAAGRPDAEAGVASSGGGEGGPNSRVGAEFMRLDEHHGAAAIARDGEIATVTREIDTSGDSRQVRWSRDPDREEVVIDIEDSAVKALTMARYCAALLSEPAFQQVLTVNNLAGGEDRSGLGGLPIENPYVLRSGACLGHLRNVDATAKRYQDRLRQARDRLLSMTSDVHDSDGTVNKDAADLLLRKAHGLAGTATRLYDMLGVSIRRQIRIPDWAVEDDDRRKHIAKMVAKQTSIAARYGVYSAHRVLHELRPDKREQLLGAPDVDDTNPSGNLIGSWVLVGPEVESLEPYLRDLDEYLDLQEDGENYAPFMLDAEIVDGNAREHYAAVTTRLCSFKNIKTTRQAVSIMQTLVGDPLTAAAALGQLGQEDKRRDMDIYEVRRGLQRALTRGTIDPQHILPDVGSSVVSAVVAALLDASEPVSKSTVADLAGKTTQAMNYDANQKIWDQLEAAGLLERQSQGPGKATMWRIRLPFKAERHDSGRPTPRVYADKDGSDTEDPWLTNEICEAVLVLVDDVGTDLDVDVASEAAMEAFSGMPKDRDIGTWIRENPEVRPLVELVASLLDQDLGDVGDPEHMTNYSSTVQLGDDPSPATSQSSLDSAVIADD